MVFANGFLRGFGQAPLTVRGKIQRSRGGPRRAGRQAESWLGEAGIHDAAGRGHTHSRRLSVVVGTVSAQDGGRAGPGLRSPEEGSPRLS